MQVFKIEIKTINFSQTDICFSNFLKAKETY